MESKKEKKRNKKNKNERKKDANGLHALTHSLTFSSSLPSLFRFPFPVGMFMPRSASDSWSPVFVNDSDCYAHMRVCVCVSVFVLCAVHGIHSTPIPHKKQPISWEHCQSQPLDQHHLMYYAQFQLEREGGRGRGRGRERGERKGKRKRTKKQGRKRIAYAQNTEWEDKVLNLSLSLSISQTYSLSPLSCLVTALFFCPLRILTTHRQRIPSLFCSLWQGFTWRRGRETNKETESGSGR